MSPPSFLSLFLAVCATALSVNAQSGRQNLDEHSINACASGYTYLAPVRGLKLGITVAEFQKTFASALGEESFALIHLNRLLTGTDGAGELFVRLNGLALFGDKWKGITYVGATFFNDKLYDLHITYDDSVSWETSQQFIEAISPALRLAPDNWRILVGGVATSTAQCRDFTATFVLTPLRYSSRLSSLHLGFSVPAIKEASRIAHLQFEEKKRKAFKP